MYKNTKNAFVVGAIVLVVFVFALITYNSFKSGSTSLYFNAETEIPDETLYLKDININSTTNILSINENYNILFTIQCDEKDKTDYLVQIKSKIYEDNINVTLKPGEKKQISLKINPSEDNKWELDVNDKTNYYNEIDITDNSWLANKESFQVIVEDGSLPTLTKTNYYLPISSSLNYFGDIYHMNITFGELLNEPFEKEYITETVTTNNKIVNIEEIKLYVKNNKIIINTSKSIEEYVSNNEVFLIKVIKLNNGLEIEEESGFQEAEQISFWYNIR